MRFHLDDNWNCYRLFLTIESISFYIINENANESTEILITHST